MTQARNVADFANNVSSTGAIMLSVGTSAERPASPSAGMTRYNTNVNSLEWYDAYTQAWRGVSEYTTVSYEIQYLVIGGGGGGNFSYYCDGSGGGAGGYRCNVTNEYSGGNTAAEPPYRVLPNMMYSVIVGAGGTGSNNSTGSETGSPSSFGEIVSLGGGRGGSHRGVGGAGGSGGGSGAYYSDPPDIGLGGYSPVNQGFQGGSRRETTVGPLVGAGGGGAGSRPSGGSSTGGNGLASSITGTSVTRGGGGGGAAQNTSANGGSGGGGASNGSAGTATSGTVNTGGGGGGTSGNFTSSGTAGNGGSGIVIIRYYGGQRGTGGTVTSALGYTIHTFTSSGTYTA